MRLLYFAWMRERIGLSTEEIDLPGSVVTAGDLVAFLASRGGGYAAAFHPLRLVRVAVDHEHVDLDAPLAGAREVALFPPMTGG